MCRKNEHASRNMATLSKNKDPEMITSIDLLNLKFKTFFRQNQPKFCMRSLQYGTTLPCISFWLVSASCTVRNNICIKTVFPQWNVCHALYLWTAGIKITEFVKKKNSPTIFHRWGKFFFFHRLYPLPHLWSIPRQKIPLTVMIVMTLEIFYNIVKQTVIQHR